MRLTKPLAIEYYSDNVWSMILAFPDGILQSYYRIVSLLKEAGVHLGMPYSRVWEMVCLS